MVLTLALMTVAASGRADSHVAVDFERLDLDGRTVRLSDYRGQWVLVNFWATWCSPCIREIPLLEALHRERADVVVIGVNFEEIDDAALAGFLKELSVSYPVVKVGDEPLLPFEPLLGLPATFVVSPEGRLVSSKTGEIDQSWLRRNLPQPTDSQASGAAH